MEAIIKLPEFIDVASRFGMTVELIVLFFFLFSIVAGCLIFKKTGNKAYKAVIPFYSEFVLFRTLGMSYILPIIYTVTRCYSLFISPFLKNPVLTILMSLTGFVAGVIMYMKKSVRLSDYFGKSQPFKVGLIVMQPVFLLILAFGRSRFLKNDLNEVKDE